MARAHAEVAPCGRLDAIRAAPVVDVVEVGLEQIALRMACLELERDQRFASLAQQRWSVVVGEVHAPRELLCERRRAARPRPRRRAVRERPRDRERVDAGMDPEPLVLGGDRGLDRDRRDLIERDRDAGALGGVTQQRDAVAVDDERAGHRRTLIERLQRREVCVGQQRARHAESASGCGERGPSCGAPHVPMQEGYQVTPGQPRHVTSLRACWTRRVVLDGYASGSPQRSTEGSAPAYSDPDKEYASWRPGSSLSGTFLGARHAVTGPETHSRSRTSIVATERVP